MRFLSGYWRAISSGLILAQGGRGSEMVFASGFQGAIHGLIQNAAAHPIDSRPYRNRRTRPSGRRPAREYSSVRTRKSARRRASPRLRPTSACLSTSDSLASRSPAPAKHSEAKLSARTVGDAVRDSVAPSWNDARLRAALFLRVTPNGYPHS